MPKTVVLSRSFQPTSPDYTGLVEFLVSPLLEDSDAFSVDCEKISSNQRVWIRLAFEGTDKGRIYGRGGRNLQAIRTVLETAAALAGESLYLEIYESQGEQPRRQSHYGSNRTMDKRRHRPRPSDSPGFSLRPRF